MCLNFALTVVRSDKRALHLVVICNPFGVWPFSTQDIMKLRCDCILVRLEAAFLYLCRKASRSLSSIGPSSFSVFVIFISGSLLEESGGCWLVV